MVFRGDVVERVEALVDGRRASTTASFGSRGHYRDWARRRRTVRSLDLSILARGLQRFDTHLRTQDGRAHTLSMPLLIR